MTYYATLDEDLKRARQILEAGADGLPADVRPETIYGMDNYAAYKLLESFVAAIDDLQRTNAALAAAAKQLEDDREYNAGLVKERDALIRQLKEHAGGLAQ